MSSPKTGEYSDTIRIRAHHLLCIQGFQGKGYSPEFIENMKKIIYFLNSDLLKKVEIINSCDDICSSCPHVKEDFCSESNGSEKRIKMMDNLTLKFLGLESGNEHYYKDVLNKISNNINFSQLKSICGHCSWSKDCLFYLSFE